MKEQRHTHTIPRRLKKERRGGGFSSLRGIFGRYTSVWGWPVAGHPKGCGWSPTGIHFRVWLLRAQCSQWENGSSKLWLFASFYGIWTTPIYSPLKSWRGAGPYPRHGSSPHPPGSSSRVSDMCLGMEGSSGKCVRVFDVSYLRCHSISNTLEVGRFMWIPSLVESDPYSVMW